MSIFSFPLFDRLLRGLSEGFSQEATDTIKSVGKLVALSADMEE